MSRKRNLKVAVVSPVYTKECTWGPVTVIRNVVKGLKNRGYNFVIYAANAESPNKLAKLAKRDLIDGAIVKRYDSMFNISSYWITPMMIVDMLKDDFDLIHAHCARSFQFDVAALVSVLKSKPLVVSAHGTLATYLYTKEEINQKLIHLQKIHNALLKFVLSYAKIATALSKLEAEEYMRLFGLPSNKIFIIPNGIDLSLYKKMPSKGFFRKKYCNGDDRKIILYLGRVNKIKGIEFLIQSFSYLVNVFKRTDVIMVIAGPDDGYKNEAKILSRSLKVSDKVIFTGFLTEWDKLCAFVDATVVVHPESFNVTLIAPLEAAAAGKPIILSKGNYLGKIAVKNGFGFAVQYGNVIEMASLINKVISDTVLATDMGAKGREFVFKNLSWSHIIDVYDELYRIVAKCKVY